MIALGTAWLVIAGLVFFILLVSAVFVLALCSAAGRADEAIERARQMREEANR